MEDSCGPTKPKRLLVDVKIAGSSRDAEEITGNGKQVDLPHLVVGKIMENLDFKDLLQCSLVNKFWMHEARRLLREKHKCALTVDLGKPAVSEIFKFKTTLAAAEWLLPYGSLLIVKCNQSDEDKSWLNEEPPTVCSTVAEHKLVESAIKYIMLRAGPFKIVQLDVNVRCRYVETCIIRNLIAEVQKTVEVLTIKNLDSRNVFENTSRFPELKKFEIYTCSRISDPDVRIIQNFLQYSEKLENVGLMSCGWLKLLDTIPRARKLAVVKEFTCVDVYKDPRRAAEFAELEPKLEYLDIPSILVLRCNPYARNEYEEEISIWMSLLLSSRASLIELQVTYEILEEIRREKPCVVFENLRCLSVDVPHFIDRRNFDKNRTIIALFPKLNELNFDY